MNAAGLARLERIRQRALAKNRGDRAGVLCPIDGFRLYDYTDGNGAHFTRCQGCERRAEHKCMECGRPVEGRAWRCAGHQRVRLNGQKARYIASNRETRNARRRATERRPDNRAAKAAYHRRWREQNPIKAMLQARRQRLRRTSLRTDQKRAA